MEYSSVYPLSLVFADLDFEYLELPLLRYDLFQPECALCQAGLCTQQIVPPDWHWEELVIVHGKIPGEWGN